MNRSQLQGVGYATLGVSPDTTILSKAKVKAEKADSLKEEDETCEHCGHDKSECECDSLGEVKGDDEDENMDESFLTAEDDKDDPADASVEDADTESGDTNDTEDDSMDIDLADLIDGDEDLIDLTPAEDEGEGEDLASTDDEGEGTDVTPDEDVEEGFSAGDDMMWSDDDDEDAGRSHGLVHGGLSVHVIAGGAAGRSRTNEAPPPGGVARIAFATPCQGC